MDFIFALFKYILPAAAGFALRHFLPDLADLLKKVSNDA